MMNIESIERLKALAHWAQNQTGKSANFEINFWSYSHRDKMETSYKLWIEDIFCQSSTDINLLIALMPYVEACVSENRRLAA